MNSNLLIPMLILVLVFGVLIFLVILKGGKLSQHGLDKKVYQAAWLKIENDLDRNHPATFTLAVLNADKLFDQALRESGVVGETLGERLKNARTRFQKPVLDKIWQAHKLRNRIAHETNFNLNYAQTKLALAGFKRGLKDLGAI